MLKRREQRKRRTTASFAAFLGLLLAGTGCGLLGDPGEKQELKGRTVTVAGVWSGVERRNFEKVLDAFSEKTGARTRFITTGEDVSGVVSKRIEDGRAPDVVMVPQVGVLRQFARKDWLEQLSPEVYETAGIHFAPVWQDYGTVDGDYYGLYFKASHKSTVWYRPEVFDRVGATPPKTYQAMLETGHRIAASGTPGFSVAGKSGWPLTDWFENIYLSQAGFARYDKLAAHVMPWTHPTVIRALATLGELFGDEALVAGGGAKALRTDFPASVGQVFGRTSRAGMVYEGDFVGGLIRGQFDKRIGRDAGFFLFPSVDGGKAPVVGGGDAAVVLKDGRHQETAMRFVEYLATPEAAEIWAAAGGFISPNESVDLAKYQDPVTRRTADSLVKAGDAVRFDMSDQAPAGFGGTPGKGEWKILQDFLRDPSDPAGTAEKLEAAAAKAYGDERGQ